MGMYIFKLKKGVGAWCLQGLYSHKQPNVSNAVDMPHVQFGCTSPVE